ncbi:CGNR zinc finger domain-containing protein [soil metagenome]
MVGIPATGPSTGQWFTALDGHRWWFDSGSPALDFAYTGAMGTDLPWYSDAWEDLHEPADLGRWLGDRFAGIDATTSERDLVDATALRGAIARIATAASRGDAPAAADIDVIKLFAATPDIPPSLAGGTRQAGRSRARVGQALSQLAREAVALFHPDALGRIRECSADDCQLVYLDDSRSNNRRWCSMQRCGNRAKVRAHRAKFGG